MATSTERANNQPRPQRRSYLSRTRIYVSEAIVAICLVIALAGTATAGAQAIPTASRKLALAPFALGTFAEPGYGQSANFAWATGIDITPPFALGRIEPSLEIRVTGDSGPIIREYTYSPGFKFTLATTQKFHPYATTLIGAGTGYFVHPTIPTHKGLYAHNSAPMLTVGIGTDYDLSRSWQLRADYIHQFWIGLYEDFDPKYPLAPDFFSVGVNYRISSRHDVSR
jgi:hypothetical protein